MNQKAKKRVTMKLKQPNPLFEQWLAAWRDEAIEKSSKMQYCYQTALTSLRKYPLPLESGRDCKILQGFGDKLCQMLDQKLQQFNASATNATTAKSPRAKAYVPAIRSGAYAILLTLYTKSLEPKYPGHMLKVDIIKYGQQLCDKSFVKPDPGTFYTSWSSMKTLLDKKLIIKAGKPSKFSLTDDGILLAHKLYTNSKEEVPASQLVRNDSGSSPVKVATSPQEVLQIAEKKPTKVTKKKNTKQLLRVESNTSEEPTTSQSQSQEDTFIFAPFTFNVILYVDKQETSGQEDDPTLSQLTILNVPYEVKHLKVGDYAWICREKTSNKELILPYIVERKRMDDFGASIKDGRFHEQKFRLKQSGIQNLIYLIESYGSNTHTGLPIANLYQAATNTLIQDEFQVKFTESLRGTVQYLATFTSIIKSLYENKTLVSCPKENLTASSIQDDLVSLMSFNEFNKGASKSRNFKVHELFVRQLVQLSGVSVEKAIAIVEKYQTPRLLYQSYTNATDGEKLLSSIVFGKLNKKIGPAISKTIYQLFTTEKF